MNMDYLMPHGMCWFWDWKLIMLHSPADLLTFFAYAMIPLTAIYIFKRGQLKKLAVTYPKLWILGMLFVGTCSFSHLGSFLEIWIGGMLYYITGVNKVIMSIVSLWFAIEFWKVRDDIILLVRTLIEIRRQDETREREILRGL